ncbi:hypothetical protein N3K66_008011 [Trichothecium roseum]|uniref:Uncharacterized protein n=1 Tax=Trichothecium roseum TaxID=47278 RepID=A0ACC0US68_9HYPO|nr:hypothetical protein N3K66_008011 [Trichothecium roseum]
MSGKDAGRIARALAGGRGRPLGGFPFPLNVGIDVCAVDRVGAILGGRFGARFLRRVLAEEELRRDGKEERLRALREKYGGAGAGAGAWPYGGGREGGKEGDGEGAVARRGAAEEVQAFARHIAGRFAAKEAVIKAHTYRKLFYSDVVIESRQALGARGVNKGSLVARIKGGGDGRGGDDATAMVSISHEEHYATAVCLGTDRTVLEDLPGYQGDDVEAEECGDVRDDEKC